MRSLVPVLAALCLALPAQPAEAAHHAKELERDDSYEEAAAFYLLKRSPDGHSLPLERYLEAKWRLERMPRFSLPLGRLLHTSAKQREHDAAVGTWIPLGPGNVGGRTRSLVINPSNPSIMYAGSVGGGVWKTTDGGASWTPLTDMMPSIGISSLALDPTNPDLIYAGTGEWFTGSTGTTLGNAIRGLGIFRSTDAGATWTQLPGTSNSSFYYVNKVLVSPNDNNRLYAATWSGVWTSPDQGLTWMRTLNRASPNNGCQDLVIRTDQSMDYLFAACGTLANPQSAIFRNMDAAGSGKWESVFSAPNMGRTSLALAPSNQSTIYALSASREAGDYSSGLLAVYRSTGNGDSGTWETRVTNKDANRFNTGLLSDPRDLFLDACSNSKPKFRNQGGWDNVIAVDPGDPDKVWVGGIDLFRSDDGGANWGLASMWYASGSAHADHHAIVFHPAYDGNANQTMFSANDGGVYRTDNAREGVAMGPRAACLPYSGKVAWKSLNNGYAATQFYAGAVYPGGAAYFGGTQDTGTPRGSDAAGPNNWSVFPTGDGGYGAIDPHDANIIYIESQRLGLRKSTDGGRTFTSAIRGITGPETDFLFIIPYVMDPSASKRLYLGGRSLWHTNDGAANWSAASSPVPASNGIISAIAVSPADPNRVLFGTSLGFLYSNTSALTTDVNTDWQSTQPRTGYVSSVAFDPVDPNVAYATYSQFKSNPDQGHVYMSADGGVTWTGIDGTGDTGLPDIPVFSLLVDPRNSANLYVASDIGVFASLDGGATWARDDNPFANAVTETLVLDRSAGAATLFAFTHGRGVWKTTLPDSGTPCRYAVSKSLSFEAIGGKDVAQVTTGNGCVWAAMPLAGEAGVASPAKGTGSGPVSISMPVNSSTQARTASIAVQDQTVAVTQAGALVAGNNDELPNAQRIIKLPYAGIEDTRRYSSNASDPIHSCTNAADFKTVWWIVTAPAGGNMELTVLGERYDVHGDSGVVLTAYPLAGVSGMIGKEINCVTVPRGTGAWTTTRMRFPVTQGTAYAIEVAATGSTSNDGGFIVLTAAMLP